jgi:UDP-glucose 4-epimerase
VRALVTGGAGFIGSHLVDVLLERGEAVYVVDHLRREKTNLDQARANGAQVVQADVTDVEAMVDAFTRARPDVVYHLAAQIDVRRSVLDPSTDAHVNVGGTAAVLEAAKRTGTRRMILASTAGVYGDPAQLPTSETSPVAPLSPYGASKAAAETYMQLFLRLHGLSTLALRMANVYGPRQDPHGEAGVVAIFSGVAQAGGVAKIFGDGRQTRDYVHVSDVVAAFAAAGRSQTTGVLNVSTGNETSVAELARLFGLQTSQQPGRPGEVTRSCLDPSAAHQALGWRARITLAEGLRTLG